jgi:ABC-type transporter Mla subunit MlaD
MTIYEETQQSIIKIPAHLEDISDQLKRTNDRLERIADALELLASAIQPQFKDRDATLNVQAVCYNQEI